MTKMKSFQLLFFLTTALFFSACSDDDDGGAPPVIDPTGSIEVENQTVVNGTLTIDMVVISEDGWLVIYRDNAGVQGTEVLGQTHLDAGTHNDVTVELDENVELIDGETLWAALHVDENEDGIFDWNGSTGIDVAIRTGLNNVAESFIVTVDSSVTAEDQQVIDNTITVSNVNLQEAGWLVIHADADGSPGAVIGVSDPLTAGSHDDVVITLDETAEVNVGDMLWIMMHSDTGVVGEYEFDGANGLDLPVTDGEGPIMTSITVTE